MKNVLRLSRKLSSRGVALHLIHRALMIFALLQVSFTGAVFAGGWDGAFPATFTDKFLTVSYMRVAVIAATPVELSKPAATALSAALSQSQKQATLVDVVNLGSLDGLDDKTIVNRVSGLDVDIIAVVRVSAASSSQSSQALIKLYDKRAVTLKSFNIQASMSSSVSQPASQIPTPVLHQVRIEGGKRICGVLLESKPGLYILIQTDGGERKVLDWDDIVKGSLQTVLDCQSGRPRPMPLAGAPSDVSAQLPSAPSTPGTQSPLVVMPRARIIVPAERYAKHCVLLVSGAKYYGQLQEGSGAQTTVKLATGEIKQFQAQDVMRVSPVPAADSVGATAEAQVERLILLHDGTMVRGEIVEHVPQDRVTLLLPDKSVRRLVWADINNVQPTPRFGSAASVSSGMRAQLTQRGVEHEGEVVEYVPNKSIALRLDGGEVRRFPWADDQLLTGFTPLRPSSLEERQTARHLALGRILVVIRSATPGLTLRRLDAEGGWTQVGLDFRGQPISQYIPPQYETVCRSPCEVWFPKEDLRGAYAGTYIIAGDDIDESERFTIPSDAQRVTLHVTFEDSSKKALVRVEKESPAPNVSTSPQQAPAKAQSPAPQRHLARLISFKDEEYAGSVQSTLGQMPFYTPLHPWVMLGRGGEDWGEPQLGPEKVPLGWPEFYEVIGRPDLAKKYRHRFGAKVALIAGGAITFVLGAVSLGLAVDFNHADGRISDRVRSAAAAGGVLLPIGLMSVLTGVILRRQPISARDARRLAARHNERLQEEADRASTLSPEK